MSGLRAQTVCRFIVMRYDTLGQAEGAVARP